MDQAPEKLAVFTKRDGIGWIDLDDGKVNVISSQMLIDLGDALDAAEEADGVVVLRGRPGVFSAGFDMSALAEVDAASLELVLGGFRLAARLLAHPRPVVIGCTGHAIAMGAFLVLSGDYRVGVEGPAKIAANEVAIGLTLPRTATEILRSRLTPAAFQRAALLAEFFDPGAATDAGFLDEVVAATALDDRLEAIATSLGQLDDLAQRETKQRVRAPLLAVLQESIERDAAEHGERLAGLA